MDSSSSDEAGFVSPLASPHHNRYKGKPILFSTTICFFNAILTSTEEGKGKETASEKEEIENKQTEGTSPSVLFAQNKKKSAAVITIFHPTFGCKTDEMRASLGDHPFPEFTLQQPFDPCTSTSYKLLHLRYSTEHLSLIVQLLVNERLIFLLKNNNEQSKRTPKYTPRWVYYAELERMTTLVIITSNHATTGAKVCEYLLLQLIYIMCYCCA